MFKKYHTLFMSIFYVLDISLTVFALYLADTLARFLIYPGFGVFDYPIFDRFAYLVVVIIWTISFRIFPIYSSKRAEPLFHELANVGAAAAFSWIIFTGCLFLFSYSEAYRIPAIYFGLLDLGLLLAFHVSLRIILRYLRASGYNLKKVLVIGAGDLGRRVAWVIKERPWTGFSIIGFLDNDIRLKGKDVLSIPVLGTLDKTREIVSSLQVDDEVIIALPLEEQKYISGIIESIEDIPVNVRITPEICNVEYLRPNIEDLWGIPLIGIRQSGIVNTSMVIKRVFDIVGALLGLILLSPIMLLVSILIKLDSKGPVLFVQERVGENGKKFKIYKFRTMVEGSVEMLPLLVNLDVLEEPVFKLKNDPRITPLGHLLRRTSMDETPQFYNVLKGEMSLVGPRPEEAAIVERYNSFHRSRLMAKPGLTGPAQITGRADLTLKDRVKLEIDYINNHTLLTDLKILVKTIPVIIKGIGCY
jgi:exopolysaccharide biosynthesis polyprenyl glycosylphosphotransferase